MDLRKIKKIIRKNRFRITLLTAFALLIALLVVSLASCGRINVIMHEKEALESRVQELESTAGESEIVNEEGDPYKYGHIPELTHAGYVVGDGSGRQDSWAVIRYQEDAQKSAYDNRYWEVGKDGLIRYTEPGKKCMVGIDVSEYQGDIDWQQVAGYGIEFVIVRVGYRGYESGKFVQDEKCQANLDGALNAGLKAGVYFVTQAVDEAESEEEAGYVLEIIGNRNIEMPIYLDMEPVYGGVARTDDLSEEQRTKNAAAFCKKIEDSGYRAGIYANQYWFSGNLHLKEVEMYDIWFAKYGTQPDYPYKFDAWQFSETGTVPGIEGSVDLNVKID